MRYGNGAADNMLSVFQITNEENACLSLKKQAQFLKLHSISGRSFAPLKKIVIVVASIFCIRQIRSKFPIVFICRT